MAEEGGPQREGPQEEGVQEEASREERGQKGGVEDERSRLEELVAAATEQVAALTAERDALRSSREALAAELAGAQRAAREAEWRQLIVTAAAGVKGDAEPGVRAAKLKAKAEEYGITDGEKLKTLAADLWPQPGVQPDSGRTEGGGQNWRTLPIDQRIALGLKKK